MSGPSCVLSFVYVVRGGLEFVAPYSEAPPRRLFSVSRSLMPEISSLVSVKNRSTPADVKQ